MTHVNKWYEPQDVDAITATFPGRVSGTLLPLREEIPEEFQDWNNPWCRLVSQWFFRGLEEIRFREGIDYTKAVHHLKACIGSFEPKHEHKQAGTAYLMSLWCDPTMIED